NLSHAYGVPPAPEVAERLLLEALDRGVTLFDTAALYGFGANEQLVGRVLKPHRSRIVLSSKGGMAGVTGDDGVMRRVIDGRPETIRRNCEDSLRRLGTEVIDLYYLHRVDLKNRVPIEDSVGAMSRLVEQGKLRALGLSEASAATLRRAHAVLPIAALQNEYSLWTRNAELGTLEACAELGIAFVAFSPLARAYLTGALRDVGAFDPKDIRRQMPRFEPAHYAKNLALLEGVAAIAREAGCTLAQLALAWLLHRGPHVIPIPGTTSAAHLAENLGASGVALTPAQIERLDALINQRTVTGSRYTAATQAEIDTEEFPPV
ncbi:MAG TPA: aldo/keto reductase, partial [Burkholderiaceae bacterium]|nr:aldo/keto reductase [Burkholderiaceae bacterium]